jgi:hypothetical protein
MVVAQSRAKRLPLSVLVWRKADHYTSLGQVPSAESSAGILIGPWGLNSELLPTTSHRSRPFAAHIQFLDLISSSY